MADGKDDYDSIDDSSIKDAEFEIVEKKKDHDYQEEHEHDDLIEKDKAVEESEAAVEHDVEVAEGEAKEEEPAPEEPGDNGEDNSNPCNESDTKDVGNSENADHIDDEDDGMIDVAEEVDHPLKIYDEPAAAKSGDCNAGENDAHDSKDDEAKESMKKQEGSIDAKKPGLSSNWKFAILAGVLIIILLAVIFYSKISSQRNVEVYNHFEFYKQDDGYWYTLIQVGPQPFSIPFYHTPKSLEDIVVEPGIKDKFSAIRNINGSIFITLDPDGNNNKIVVAGVEVAKITGQLYGILNIPTRSAFTKEPANATANTEIPIVTCDQANDQFMIIWLTVTDKNLISSRGNCIMLEGKSYDDLVRVADRLDYHILGIMQ